MRKRQWKKILSVVLALAMVFSMNVSAFADEVTDPVAVEEPAAEQPAEAPAAEEPAAEEPAPAEEEAPPAEAPAPAEAEEPAGGDTTLEILGWTFGFDDSNPEEAPSYEGAFVTVSYAGTTITDATNPQDITLSSNGTGTAAITITGGNNKFYVIKEDDSFVEANGFSLTSSMTAGVDLKKVADQPDAPVATTNYTIDKSAADKWTVKAVNASQRLEYLVATSSTGTYADLDNSTGADITATDKAAGKKMFVRVKAIYDETEDTGSVITTPASVAAEIDYTPAPTPEGSFTVSGFTFEIDDTTTVSDISYTGGIGEVTFSAKEGKKASVTMKKTGSADPVSVNLATADVTVVADDSITGDMPVSFKGTGLVKFTKKGTFESVASGLTLSGNDVDVLAINVDSEGAATKYTLITKEEAGKKVDEGAVRIAIASKDTGSWSYSTSDEAFTPASASYTLSVDTLDLVPFATKLVASEDAIKGVSVEYSTEEKKNVIILATDSDISTATFTYITVPVQGKYNIENALNSGVATAGGVDLTQWIYNKDKKYDNISKYEFIISSNETLDQYTTRTGTGWNTWVTGTTIKKVVNNAGVEAGKTYYLIARKKATGSEFASVAQVVGSFVPLKDTSISINLARTLSPNYTGDVWNLDSEDAAKFLSSQNTNAVNLSMFSFTYNYPTGLSVVDERKYAYQYELDEEDNVFRVNDSDGNKVGDLTLHFYKDYSAGKFSNEQDVAYYALTPGLWGVSVSFAPYSEASQVYGAQADSNTISFNVVKAPVKYVPKVTPNPSVSGSLVSPDYEATNIVTGAPVNTGITYFTGSESYLINSKVSTSFNGELPAGTYKVAVSAGDLASSYYAVSKENDEDKTGRYYTDYSTEIDWTVIDNKATNLVVTGAQKSADDRGTVYYGANLAAVEGAVETKATLAGTEVTLTNKDNFIVLSAVSNDLVHAKALTDAEMAKISANQTVYAYYKTCEFQSLTVSSAAIPVTISKRPIDIIYDADGNGTADTLKTVRGADLISTVSASKLVGTINEIEMDFHGTESKTLKGSVLIDTTKGPDVKLDTSMLDKNIPTDGTEAVPLTGYSLSSNLLENFTTGSDTVDYLIEARYYVQYILEYSGTDGSIKKKYVSTNVIDKDNLDNPVTYGSWITIDPATTLGEKMALSWGGILPAGDEITGWKVTRSDYTNVDEISTYNGTTDVYATEYDYLVYAVVTAAATKEGVMVKSIAPVAYSMRAHVEQGSSKKNVSRDLDVVLYDKNKTVKLNKGDSKYGCFFDDDALVDDWYINPNCVLIEKDTTAAKAWVKVCPKLVYGQDYTITVKNNKNASVAYDPSVSNNNGEDGTFKQLFAEKKRPQVVVKGKGDYKKLNTTILFDILPRNIRPAVNDEISITGIDEFYLAGKTLQIKQKVTDGYWQDNDKWKKVNVKAGKASAKAASGFTGDYVVNVYKVGTNSRTLVTNFKKIADGDYEVEIKGVNNYYDSVVKPITVINGVPFAKQGFKFTKKVDWAADTKLSKFNIKVTNKKAKAEIPVVKASETNDKAGYYVSEVKDMYGYPVIVEDEGLTTLLTRMGDYANAGKYNVTLRASDKLTKDSSIFGDKTITVEVKGKKLQASNFLLDGKAKLSLEYDGEATKQPVQVTLKKALADSDKYIPMKNGSLANKNIYEYIGEDANKQDKALNWYKTNAAEVAYKASNVSNPEKAKLNIASQVRNGYADTGVKAFASQVNKNTWNFGYNPANQDMGTYYIYIYPTGPYYADGGYVRLSYTRAGFNLSKTKLVEFKAADAELNVNGTYTDVVMKSKQPLNDYKGTLSSDGFYYVTSWVNSSGVTNVGPFEVKYSKNTKAGTATATIKANSKSSSAKKLYKGQVKTTFTINPKKVDTIYDAGSAAADDVYAVITDAVAPKSGKDPKPVVKLYQKSSYLNKSKVLKNNSDYKLLAPALVKDNSYVISGNTSGSKNFKFVDDKGKDATIKVGDFNVYGQKAKKITFTLSQGEASRYDAAQKGYIYMSGNEIKPGVTSITIDGQTTTFGKALNVSDNFIVSYSNNVKVGTATVTVTLKKNTADKTLSGNATYPYGGSATMKFKIVPHNNKNLILSE